MLFVAILSAATTEQNWELVAKLQQQHEQEVDSAKKAALDEQLVQVLNALSAEPASLQDEERSDFVVLETQEVVTEQSITTEQEPSTTGNQKMSDLDEQPQPVIQDSIALKRVQILEKLEERFQKLDQDVTTIKTIYCNKKLLTFDDKIVHDQISLFLTSTTSQIRAYLDTARSVELSEADQQQIIYYVFNMFAFLEAFICLVDQAHAKVISVFICLPKDEITWSDVQSITLEIVENLVNYFQDVWLNIQGDVSKDELVLDAIEPLENIVYNTLYPTYQSSIFKRLWSSSSLDCLLSITWDGDERENFKDYAHVMTLSFIAQQEHDYAALQELFDEINNLVVQFEHATINSAHAWNDKNMSKLVACVFKTCIFNLLCLKAELEQISSIKIDYLAAPAKAESYLAHAQIIKDPLFKELYSKIAFRPCMVAYMTSLDFYFKSEVCTVEVMYDLYSALYRLKQLKNRAAQGLLKKAICGEQEYHLLLDQMLDILEKSYKTVRATLLPPQQGFMQKLMSGEWFQVNKIKNFISEKSSKAVVELAHKCLGQTFDNKESATVYVVSVVAPLVLLAALKYLVPNLPQKVQQKVVDFIRVMPSVQEDDQELAELIRENPEVVQIFLKQDPALSKALVEQIQGQLSK